MIFSEKMEIIMAVPEKYWDLNHDNNEPTEEYIHSTKQVISGLGIKPEEISHKSGSIGRGVEGTTLILILLGLFFLGNKIEKNVEAWIKIGKRIGKVFKKLLSKRQGQAYLSHPMAALLAIWHISQKVKDILLLELISTDVIPVDPSGFVEDSGKLFRINPERYYMFIFKVNSNEIHAVCLRSTGHVEFHRNFIVENGVEFY